MPIIRSTISEYLPLLGGHTRNAAWVVLHWASWSEHCSEDVARLVTSSEQCNNSLSRLVRNSTLPNIHNSKHAKFSFL
jgi:hypothetical protein